jgi:hypothetical protein
MARRRLAPAMLDPLPEAGADVPRAEHVPVPAFPQPTSPIARVAADAAAIQVRKIVGRMVADEKEGL